MWRPVFHVCCFKPLVHTHTRSHPPALKVKFYMCMAVRRCVGGPSDSLNAALCRHQVSLLLSRHTHTRTRMGFTCPQLSNTHAHQQTATGHNKVHSINANTNTHIHARCVTVARLFSAFSVERLGFRLSDSALHDPHS